MNAQHAFRLLAVLLALPLVPASARSQDVRFDLAPRFGMVARTSALGPAAPAEGPWYLRLEQIDPTSALEIETRARWPGSHLGLRFLGLVTLPANAPGFFDCYPGLACPAVLLRSPARVWVLAAAVDAQYSPLHRDRVVQPFAAFGVGVKRYRFSWPSAEVLVSGGTHAESALALRAGLGVEFVVRGQSIRAEVADWWSGRGGKIGDDPGVLGLEAPRRRAQHDISVNLGWRLLSF